MQAVKLLRFSVDNSKVASIIVAAVHSGGAIREELKGELRSALLRFGSLLCHHDMWDSVTSHPPHLAILRRLCSLLSLDAVEIFPAIGYTSADEFQREVAGFTAYYERVRASTSIIDKKALQRAERLFLTEPAVSRAGESEESDSSEESDEADDSDEGGFIGDVRVGITDSRKVKEAIKNVLHENVTEGLIANQRLDGTPKGKCNHSNFRSKCALPCKFLQELAPTKQFTAFSRK